jgi:F0F1-type ATP synthase membrane subunit c/vacuolar-type H+-ATPase subunit K
MERNVGGLDRAVRIVLGIALIASAAMGYAGGILLWAALLVGLAMLVTAATQSCIAYSALGISTRRGRKK